MPTTTPLGFAIRFADPFIVRGMGSKLSLPRRRRFRISHHPLAGGRAARNDHDVAHRLRSRCVSQDAKPIMFVMLLDLKLDFAMWDLQDRDTALHMICEDVKEYTKEPVREPGRVG